MFYSYITMEHHYTKKVLIFLLGGVAELNE